MSIKKVLIKMEKSIEKVLFRTVNIQKLGRIALPKELMENLDLFVGQKIVIYLDVKNRQIILEPIEKMAE